MKKILSLSFILVLAFIQTVFANNINVNVNGENISFLKEPIIQNGVTLVPMRPIFESLDMDVDWVPETKQIVAKKDEDTIILTVGSKFAFVNDELLNLSEMPIIIDGTTYVQARFIAESIGANVSWDGDTKTVIIKTIGYIPELTTEKITETTTKKYETTTTKPSSVSYIGNRDSGKLHESGCRYVKQMSSSNKASFSSRESAISSGYTDRCKVCKP